MKWAKRITITILLLLLIVPLLNLGVNYWISVRLPGIINEKNDSPYSITYKDLDISLLNSSILAKNITLCPKAALTDTVIKKGIYAQIERIEIQNVKLWSLIFSTKIEARSITIIQPEIVLYKENESAIDNPKSIRSAVVAPFQKIILVSDIYLAKGDIKIINIRNNKPILSIANISVKLEDITLTKELLEHKIPFSYRNYAFSCDSLYYRPNGFYDIRTKHIETTEKGLLLKKFTMIPKYNRWEFVKRLSKEKDIFTLSVATIQLQRMKWGFDKNENLFFHTGKLVVDNAAANIYRGKMPQDDLSKKPLYNKLLRELPFDLKVDTLKVKNSLLEYEEEKAFEKGAGLLSFSRLNMTATNISSGFQKTKLPDIAIKINCRFMNISPMNVYWTLNVLDKTDGFLIKGSIYKFPAERLIPFIKPYMNVTAKGMLDKVYFNFRGNDRMSGGAFGIEYDDLKFTIYRKNDREKKNKFLTAIARIFVKKDTKDRIKNTQVEVERIPEKSFYNLLWRSVADGLKKLLV
jgi:hypothetical protein